jgi:hypothetical protein
MLVEAPDSDLHVTSGSQRERAEKIKANAFIFSHQSFIS